MNSTLSLIIGFVAGGAVTFIASAKFIKKKYEIEAQKEIDDYKTYLKEKVLGGKTIEEHDREVVRNALPVAAEDDKETEENEEPNDISVSQKKDYTKYAKVSDRIMGRTPRPVKKEEPDFIEAYFISEEDHEHLPEDYDTTFMTYISEDGSLMVGNQPHETDDIGSENLEKIRQGKFPTGSTVYIRNEEIQTDFEIDIV